MKRFILASVLMVLSLPAAVGCRAQEKEKNDSTVAVLRLKALRDRRENLQREIKVQDAKRNKQIAGVSPETMEEMNDKQDSVCLALRSELVDVTLEIKEISSAVTFPQVVSQYNNMVRQQNNTGNTTAAPEASSSKPTAKRKKTNKK